MAKTNKSFSAQVRAITQRDRIIMEAVFKQSVQDVAILANVPVAQGGRMRVDTSFLRNSQVAALNGPPSGPRDKDTDRMGNPSDVSLVIAGATVNDVIWVGWSASYARFREYKDGFMEGAVKQWKKIVAKNVKRAKREIR